MKKENIKIIIAFVLFLVALIINFKEFLSWLNGNKSD